MYQSTLKEACDTVALATHLRHTCARYSRKWHFNLPENVNLQTEMEIIWLDIKDDITRLTVSLRNIQRFHLIPWCWNFVERHSESPKTLRRLCLSTKFPHHEIRWNLVFYTVIKASHFQIIVCFQKMSTPRN